MDKTGLSKNQIIELLDNLISIHGTKNVNQSFSSLQISKFDCICSLQKAEKSIHFKVEI